MSHSYQHKFDYLELKITACGIEYKEIYILQQIVLLLTVSKIFKYRSKLFSNLAAFLETKITEQIMYLTKQLKYRLANFHKNKTRKSDFNQ